MKQMMGFILFLSLFSTVYAAGTNTREIKKSVENCTKSAVSVVNMRECIGIGQKQAETLLNKVYTDILNSKTAEANYFDRLQKAQKSWFMFRLDQCTYESSDILGGTGDGLVFDNCMLDMTMDRIYNLSTK